MYFIPFQYVTPKRCHEVNFQTFLNNLIQFDMEQVQPERKEAFKVQLDFSQFKPEEIAVKLISENLISVEARHEERQDEHGFVARHFVRKYKIPEDYNVNGMKSKLSSDGILTVIAPRIEHDQTSRDIPITREVSKEENKAEIKK